MIQLTYLSTQTRPMIKDNLMDILTTARLNNAVLGVTGMLLYTGKNFIQVLEGDEKVIEALTADIRKDSRHKDIHIVEKKNIVEREYVEWTMGFKKVSKDELLFIPGLNKFYKTDLSGDLSPDKVDLINKLTLYFRNERKEKNSHDELSLNEEDKFILFLHVMIRLAVKALAFLMMLTVIWCVVDVVIIMYKEILNESIITLGKSEILHVFGAFMIVLIAVEIFINITLYIRNDVIPVKMVVATALMAVARKIIVFDFTEVSALHVIGTGILVAALGSCYWLLEREFKVNSES
ncbi:MAG: phosphate-starvation-inducible PsiE family protein [Methylicorpusculum sp.]|uniref:phosphate-starvation-inducible PsiE family protein n=2 Tax=Methylicorpusculum sp. TaxID=2713644 RepID=UPI00272196D8|nr:phosphate-starvation-inducible PsiE family protein [Methylicorpusculum sp.]MDO9238406.1 phosphate-starvation-inducible PsiE family protein [Methylicorpusculum sp.]MDP2180310.1 phosphate-starvation-inducible PsiE family protein [Methylicorpusculum sp.]